EFHSAEYGSGGGERAAGDRDDHHCHPEPPEPGVAKRRNGGGRSKDPLIATREAGGFSRGKHRGGPSTVLRCFGFAYAAPAAQDDSVSYAASFRRAPPGRLHLRPPSRRPHRIRRRA